MRTIAENPADSMTSWRFVVAALFVIAGASVAAVLSDSEPAGAHPNTCAFDPFSGMEQCWHDDHPPECPDGTTGTPPNCTPFEYGNPDQGGDVDDVTVDRVYSPEDTGTGRCGGGSTKDTDSNGNTVCRRWTPKELEDDAGNARVQCLRRDGEVHTTTFLALDPPGCPDGSVGPDSTESEESEFWYSVYNDRCAWLNAGSWDKALNDGRGGCSGIADSSGNSQVPCFDGAQWTLIDKGVRCGASQCPVPGDPGNFIAGTNGLWDEDTETCGDILTVEIGDDISVDEGDPAVLDVALKRVNPAGSSPCVEATWSTQNGSAASPADYSGFASATIQFPSGAISGAGTATLQMPAINTVADSVVEGGEQFNVRVTGASLCGGATMPVPTVDRDVATVTIRDTPANRQVSVAPTSVTVTEGNPGDDTVAQVTISHDGNAGDVASVWWQRIDRSAKRSTSSPPDNDYVALPSASGVRLAFPAGATSITADIDIVEDTVCEPTETFEVKIRDPLPTGTTAVAVDTATVTIRDDDCMVPYLSVGPDIAITEGTGGPQTVAIVDVSHGGSPGDVASVLYHVVAETATLGTDFTGAGPSGARADIPATATSTSISVDIDPDSLCEPDETFRVEISNLLPTGSAMIDVHEARVRIVDDDCSATSIRVDPDTVQVNEPDPFATLTITHDGSAGDVISVRYRLFDASATAGTDYTTVPSSGIIVNFAGATSVDVDVPIIDDAVCEGTETFTMVVDNPVARPGVTATVSSPAGRVRILDNEDCVPVILSACDEAQPAGVHSEGTPIGTHPSRGSCPVPYSWSTWPGARTAGRGSPPPRGACVGASAGHDAWNVIAGQTNTLGIFANDRLGGATPSILISPQEGRVRSLSGAGAEYVSYAWAHGSDEFIYQLRYGTGSNDFCNARVQITVLDTGPVTLGTGVVFLFPEQGGFEAANWKPSVLPYNDDGADINPHQVQTTHQVGRDTMDLTGRPSALQLAAASA